MNVVFCILAAASRFVDAVYAWERYSLVHHQDQRPSQARLRAIYAFICVGLVFPYLSPVCVWALVDYGGWLRDNYHAVYRGIIYIMAFVDFCFIPANLYWDITLGSRFITRIRQLTDSLNNSSVVAGTVDHHQHPPSPPPPPLQDIEGLSQTQTLLNLSRNTLAYIVISFVANAVLILAWAKVLPCKSPFWGGGGGEGYRTCLIPLIPRFLHPSPPPSPTTPMKLQALHSSPCCST